MSSVVEKARGGAAFSAEHRYSEGPPKRNGVVFVDRYSAGAVEWAATLQRIKELRLLRDDWDGDGSIAPVAGLVEGALALAKQLQLERKDPPDRVVASVNGTIIFEWHTPSGYQEIDVDLPMCAECRWVAEGSDEAVVSYLWWT